jgi:hypothetical protein
MKPCQTITLSHFFAKVNAQAAIAQELRHTVPYKVQLVKKKDLARSIDGPDYELAEQCAIPRITSHYSTVQSPRVKKRFSTIDRSILKILMTRTTDETYNIVVILRAIKNSLRSLCRIF